MPPPSPGGQINDQMGAHGISGPAIPSSPAPSHTGLLSGSQSSPMAVRNLTTPPKFTLPTVTDEQRPVTYILDHTSQLRSPYNPTFGMMEGSIASSPLCADLSPIVGGSNSFGGTAEVDQQVFDGISSLAGIGPVGGRGNIIGRAQIGTVNGSPSFDSPLRLNNPGKRIAETEVKGANAADGVMESARKRHAGSTDRLHCLGEATPRSEIFTFGQPLGSEWKRSSPSNVPVSTVKSVSDRLSESLMSPGAAHPSHLLGSVQDESIRKQIDFESQKQAKLKNSKKTASKSSAKTKKGCNCARSKCLKLYCECFRANIMCTPDCSCRECANNEEHAEILTATKAEYLQKDPKTFARHTAVSQEDKERQAVENRFGCSCSKSLCSKNYCECFKDGAGCKPWCKCSNCANPHGRRLEQTAAGIRLPPMHDIPMSNVTDRGPFHFAGGIEPTEPKKKSKPKPNSQPKSNAKAKSQAAGSPPVAQPNNIAGASGTSNAPELSPATRNSTAEASPAASPLHSPSEKTTG